MTIQRPQDSLYYCDGCIPPIDKNYKKACSGITKYPKMIKLFIQIVFSFSSFAGGGAGGGGGGGG